MASANFEKHRASKQPQGRRLSTGLSVIRLGSTGLGPIFDRLETVTTRYPDLEVRYPGNGGRAPAIQEISRRMVVDQKFRLGHLVVRTALHTLFERVPSLKESLTITFNSVGFSTDRSGGRFVLAVPDSKGTTQLEAERENMFSALENMADCGPLSWYRRPIDMTVAFVPESLPQVAFTDTVEALEQSLPATVTFQNPK